MQTKSQLVDDYIKKAQPFAQPILELLRTYVHDACPKVQEVIKWNFPNFTYNGQILCSMASFKTHCAFTFWLGSKLKDEFNILNPVGSSAMGQLGKIKSVNDIPSKEKLIATLHEAMKLSDEGIKYGKKSLTKGDHPLTLNGKFEELLKTAAVAYEFFQQLSPSQKREYTNWIDGAKSNTTQEKRIKQSIEWLNEHKIRNWKYLKK